MLSTIFYSVLDTLDEFCPESKWESQENLFVEKWRKLQRNKNTPLLYIHIGVMTPAATDDVWSCTLHTYRSDTGSNRRGELYIRYVHLGVMPPSTDDV